MSCKKSSRSALFAVISLLSSCGCSLQEQQVEPEYAGLPSYHKTSTRTRVRQQTQARESTRAQENTTTTRSKLLRDLERAQGFLDQGDKLLTSGDVVEACVQFDESRKISDEATTLFKLADCYARLGKAVTAAGLFKQAAEQFRVDSDLSHSTQASERADKLKANFIWLTINLPWVTPGLHVIVRHNGKDVVDWSGQPMPVDPGMQKLEVLVNNRVIWEDAIEATNPRTQLMVHVLRLPASQPGFYGPPYPMQPYGMP